MRPPRRACTAVPESIATVRSMPVPTSGFSARRQGTAWRCMFEPISARLASSCSRNGISEAATDTICEGATSMYSILSGRGERELVAMAAGHQLVDELAGLVELGVRLGDHVLAFLDRRQELDVLGDLAVLHAAVRRLDEAVVVGARVEGERVDEADVRAFRRLDRAHAAVVGRVHVAHLEAGALAREASRVRAPRCGACA